MTLEKPDHLALERYLRERNQYPERAAEIDREVMQRFGRTVAVLVLDMSGFSSSTSAHGIVHFLSRIQQMHEAVGPAVTGNRGQLIKYEADNAFAVFPSVKDAVEAAFDIHRSLAAMNNVLPDTMHVHVGIGIGVGETLLLDNQDLFGDEVNRACKLGEDIAEANETLLTEAALEAVANDYAMEMRQRSIGGLLLHYASIATKTA